MQVKSRRLTIKSWNFKGTVVVISSDSWLLGKLEMQKSIFRNPTIRNKKCFIIININILLLSTWLDETFKGAIFAWKTSLTDPLITWNYLNINSILTSDYFFNGKLNDLTNKKTDELNDLCKQKGWSFCLVTGSILDRWFDFGSILVHFC